MSIVGVWLLLICGDHQQSYDWSTDHHAESKQLLVYPVVPVARLDLALDQQMSIAKIKTYSSLTITGSKPGFTKWVSNIGNLLSFWVLWQIL